MLSKLRMIAVTALALALGGCVVSKGPVFTDLASAITDGIPTGPVKLMSRDLDSSDWKQTGSAEIAARSDGKFLYVEPDSPASASLFQVWPLQGDFFVIQLAQNKPDVQDYVYLVAHRVPEGIDLLVPSCETGKPEREVLARHGVRADSSECDISAVKDSRALFIDLIKVMAPASGRIVK